MNKSVFTVDELIEFCNNKLSIASLVFSRKIKILVRFLLGLTIVFSLKALEIMYYYPNLYWHYFGYIGFSLILFLSVFFIKRRMINKLPKGVTLSQLRLVGLKTYLVSCNITRNDLEHIQKILLREEVNSKPTFLLALPGVALIILPLWNAFLVRYFSFMTLETAIKSFSKLFCSLFAICIILWFGNAMIISFKKEKYLSLMAINRLIDELLINDYELNDK
ncbi:hypothetical protein [Desulfosporosinus sp. OT]|uniref:hypothetical protein n=1 Tax=Desulfosporosinus sp. OT TaxID=913865 RepID=UPI000223A91B|nr:hypothetical protein [Desulfosporosinus sp. OT]EGW39085.1 hypothetical protein DOT_3036 [Desulfosporosinus sp. OT]